VQVFLDWKVKEWLGDSQEGLIMGVILNNGGELIEL
jgi:hypothetical protein